MSKKIKISLISSLITFLFLFFLPIIFVASIVAVPGKVISDTVTSIGDFLSGPDSAESRKLKELFDIYVDSAEAKEQYEIAKKVIVQSKISTPIPVRYILLPFLIIKGNEEDIPKITELSIKYAFEKVEGKNTLVDEKRYIDSLFKDEYFKDKYSMNISTIEILFQRFGRELEYVRTATQNAEDTYSILYRNHSKQFAYPLRRAAIVTAEFGIYSPFGKELNHYGIDLAYGTPDLTCGQPIISSTTGIVKQVAFQDKGAGNYVSVETGNYLILYMHLDQPSRLVPGQEIAQGSYIGNIGNTGFSTGCHLHFEIRKNGVAENPRYYVDFNNPIIP